MGKFIAIGVALAVAVLIGLSTLSPRDTSNDWYTSQKQSIDLDQRAKDAQRDQARADALEPYYRAGLIMLTLGFPLVLLAVGGTAAWKFFRRSGLVAPDTLGRLPFQLDDPHYQDRATGALAAYHSTEQTRASVAPVPTSYAPHVTISPHYAPSQHYAPNFSRTLESVAGNAVLPLDEGTTDIPLLPGVTDLANIAHTPTIQSILLGLAPGGEAITVPMKNLWHIAAAGPTGQGKSNIARLIIPQVLTLGARVVIADPKWTPFDAESGEDWQPIAQRLYMPPARKASEIGDMLTWTLGELEQRLELRNQGKKVGSPIFFYLDELTTIMADVRGAEEQIARLARIGRGVGLFLLMGAHNFLVKSGMGDTRDQVRTCFYLGGDLKTGSVLLDMPQRDLGQRESELAPGVALLRSSATAAAQIVRVPYASNRAIAGLLGDGSEDMVDTSKFTSTQGPEVNPEGGLLPHSNALSPKALRVRELLIKQASQSDILADVWGVKGGRHFPQAQQELREIMAQLVGGGA